MCWIPLILRASIARTQCCVLLSRSNSFSECALCKTPALGKNCWKTSGFFSGWNTKNPNCLVIGIESCRLFAWISSKLLTPSHGCKTYVHSRICVKQRTQKMGWRLSRSLEMDLDYIICFGTFENGPWFPTVAQKHPETIYSASLSGFDIWHDMDWHRLTI